MKLDKVGFILISDLVRFIRKNYDDVNSRVSPHYDYDCLFGVMSYLKQFMFEKLGIVSNEYMLLPHDIAKLTSDIELNTLVWNLHSYNVSTKVNIPQAVNSVNYKNNLEIIADGIMTKKYKVEGDSSFIPIDGIISNNVLRNAFTYQESYQIIKTLIIKLEAIGIVNSGVDRTKLIDYVTNGYHFIWNKGYYWVEAYLDSKTTKKHNLPIISLEHLLWVGNTRKKEVTKKFNHESKNNDSQRADESKQRGERVHRVIEELGRCGEGFSPSSRGRRERNIKLGEKTGREGEGIRPRRRVKRTLDF